MLQNLQSHHWVSNTAMVAKSWNQLFFKKIKFVRLYFMFVTYLLREVDGTVISEIYFVLKEKMNIRILVIVTLKLLL